MKLLSVLNPKNFLRAAAFFAMLIAPLAVCAQQQQQHYLYRTELIQAAPGKLVELIGLFQQQAIMDQHGLDDPALWMRHSQGDRWDLLRLVPMRSYGDYYSNARVELRDRLAKSAGLLSKIHDDIAWEEDILVYGPPLEALRKAFAEGAFFHVEMFESLPDKRADLYREREMENAYSAALGQPTNFIFVRDQGAAFDIFTIGVFRNLKHYAESADVTPEAQAAAAKTAGFASAADIGPYLRTLIQLHHDTLAVAVK
ncbi:MAG TPA: hypothetical protein VIH72_15765 [Candidatus Acidoferrales bacterium]